MWISLFQLRLKQLYRIIKELGAVRIPFYLIGFLLGYRLLFEFISKEETVQWVTLGFVFLELMIQLKRADLTFLKSHVPNSKFYLMGEYFLFSLPFTLLLLIFHQWYYFLAHTLYLFILPFLWLPKSDKSSILNKYINRLSSENFEWKAGIRKNLYLIVPLYFIGIIGSIYLGIVPVILLVLWLICFSFHEKGEPITYIIAFEMSAKDFILMKLSKQVTLFIYLTMPLSLVFLIFHYEEWFLLIGILSVLSFLNIYILLTKYAFYTPNNTSPTYQTMSGFGLISLFIPFLLPVTLGLSIQYYRKSIQNLDFYLHDFAS